MRTTDQWGNVQSILNLPRTSREIETPEHAARRRERFRAVTEGARASGELVFAFDQYDSELTTQEGPWGNTQRGICWGMTADWLRRDTNYPSDRDARLAGFPWEAVRFQVASHETEVPRSLQEHGTAGRDQAALATAGLGVDAYWTANCSIRAAALAEVLARPTGSPRPGAVALDRYLLCMSGLSNGGHAVAFRAVHYPNGGVVIHYLDAGYGCFRFNTAARFTRWFAEFLIASGYDSQFNWQHNLSRVVPRHLCPALPEDKGRF